MFSDYLPSVWWNPRRFPRPISQKWEARTYLQENVILRFRLCLCWTHPDGMAHHAAAACAACFKSGIRYFHFECMQLKLILIPKPVLEFQEGTDLADVFPTYWNQDKLLPWVATGPNFGVWRTPGPLMWGGRRSRSCPGLPTPSAGDTEEKLFLNLESKKNAHCRKIEIHI